MLIYLDNNATTRVLPEVVESMLPFYSKYWGNPSSLHHFGAQIIPHINRAREEMAKLLGAQRESEIVFTSGGTESNNMALRGVLNGNSKKRHIITTQVEHPSIMMLCHQLEKEGCEVTYLSVDKNGKIDLKELKEAIIENTLLVSVMWANNETGILFPVEEIAKICLEKNILFHVDATQAVSKVPIDLKRIPIHLLSLSGHKFHAPKGIGALYVRRGLRLNPHIIGGHQERSRRGGTENVANIIGLGKAAEIARRHLEERIDRKIENFRNLFEESLLKKFNWVKRNGNGSGRVPNTTSLSFEGLDGETLCLLLSEAGIAASTGSACMAGSLGSSHILKAMGLNPREAHGTLRFSLSSETTKEEIEQAVTTLEKIILRLKSTIVR